MVLSNEEKDLLKLIVDDRFSVGAFAGMIYNDISKQDNWNNDKIELHIQLALRIRLLMQKMVK